MVFTDQLDGMVNKSPGFRFGLGFEISDRGDYYWGEAAGSHFWIHPDKKMVVLFMTQILPYDPRSYGEQIRDLAYEQ